MHDIAPTVQFVASFMGIPFNYDLPMYCQNNNGSKQQFEEFLSYQTHHPLGLRFVEEKMRNSGAL